MKSKFKIYTIVLILVLTLLSTVLSTQVFATEISDDETDDDSTTETAISEENDETDVETYEGDLYVIFSEDDSYDNSTYVMDKYVDGNVFIVGENVEITGCVNGSLFVAASNLIIDENAYIGCHIFAIANTITMSGFTYDMYATCSALKFTSESIVYRDLRLAAGRAELLGRVGRDIYLSADEITVYDSEAEEGLYLIGDINYTSSSEIENIDKITINGEVIFTQSEETSTDDIVLNYVYSGIENIVFAIVIYAILIFLTPKFVEKSKEYISTRAVLSGVIGLAFTILFPIVVVVLLIFCIGFGVAISITMIMAYVIILMINSTIVTIAINEFVANKIASIDTTWKKILMIIPVSLVIFLARQIPYIGGSITAIVLFVGVGIVVLYQFDKRKKELVSEE